ncbi:GNAT family N-acetyltransferase [Pseudogemmobacter sonorensis]|uniref:GNAT family N-acetyltransferase n=1 Tax=Pseudogemmobacter sonorensis TaxID=2989681 RepID=UPI00367824AA
MPDPDLLDSLDQIAPEDWDALAAREQAAGRPVDPFTTHRFLSALERSGSTGKGTGWLPRPLVLREGGRTGGGRIRAALPLYVKTHSQGEYIFDHGWAEAYERAGGDYYPKLQVAVPFTPATGRRFLGPDALRGPLLDAALGLAQSNGLSSLHVTFCTGDEARALAGQQGILHRVTQQFHWQSRGYGSFDDFLSDLSSRKRKMIRKERETARAHGLDLRALTGDAILPEYWQAFWTFYQDTGSRKWGRPYLTRAAFDAFHDTMRDDILLVLAFEGDRPVAGALNFIGRDTLYGRYWGTVADYPCLHFELCYYQAIDWALAHGLTRVEAGAQGEHKLARGYLPVETHSLHWINDAGFRRAVAQYLSAEARATGEEIETLTRYGPFRRGGEAE